MKYQVFFIENKDVIFTGLYIQTENIKSDILIVWKQQAIMTSGHVLHAVSKIWKKHVQKLKKM